MFKTVGIIGFGPFAQLLTQHLAPHVSLLIHSRSPITEKLPATAREVSMQEVGAAELVIIAVPFSAFESVLSELKDSLTPDTIVADVCSVKINPLESMLNILPESIPIVGTHPLFGPQSIDAFNPPEVVVCTGRGEQATLRVTELYELLGWKVRPLTPEEHDREMAMVHGLTFFIAQTMLEMKLDKPVLPTSFYSHLQQMADMQAEHTSDLTETVEKYNPYAAEMRQQFLEKATQLDDSYR